MSATSADIRYQAIHLSGNETAVSVPVSDERTVFIIKTTGTLGTLNLQVFGKVLGICLHLGGNAKEATLQMAPGASIGNLYFKLRGNEMTLHSHIPAGAQVVSIRGDANGGGKNGHLIYLEGSGDFPDPVFRPHRNGRYRIKCDRTR